MKFGSIQYLYLVWLLPAMILLAVYSFRRKDQLLRQFADRSLWDRLMPEVHRRRQVFKFLLVLAAVGLLLVAFLRPRWGFHWEEVQRKGVDILVAVDVSESMLAEDIKPNRLERAKREITDLVDLLQGDRVGLIAFAGASFLECPLTLDQGAFKMFLDYLDTNLIPVPGTDVAGAIRTATQSFVPGRRAARALILITDGEDHSQEAEKQAEEAKKKDIRIFTVGIGSGEGAPIPLQDGSGGFKKDRKGEVVMSRLDESLLQKIALSTGGNYVRSVTGDMDLKEIYQEIRGKMQAEELESTKRRRWEERFQWFLFGGILLLALEGFLPERRKSASARPGTGRRPLRLPWRQRRGKPADSRDPRPEVRPASKPAGRLAGSLLVPLMLLCSASPGMAESVYAKIDRATTAYQNGKFDDALKGFLDAQVERPEDPQLQYNIGQAHFRMKAYEDAAAAFQNLAASSADPVLQEKAVYNLGNCAFRQGKLEDAIVFYQKALELDPKDEDARFNLEFVREEIKRRLNEAKERQDKQNQEQKNQQQHQQQPGQQQAPEEQQAQKAQQDQKQGEQNPADQGGQQPQEQREQAPVQEPPPPQAGAGPEETQDEQPQAAGAGQAGTMQTGTPLSPQEAERWLNSLDDEQKELAEQQIRKALGPAGPRTGRDW